MTILYDIVVLFGVALAVIAISRQFRIPPLVGFILTGIVAGPSGLRLVDDSHRVEVLADLGVVFLLFVVGLEISRDRLRELRRTLVIGGGLQVALSVGLVSLGAILLGRTFPQALFFGFVLALSSTAIVLNLYVDRRELETPHGRVGLGILLCQDFLIVPMLVLIPMLAGGTAMSPRALILAGVSGLLILFLVYILGRYLLPWMLGLVIRIQIREISVIGALFACLGAALGTQALGFSPAMGAFLAGMLIAETESRHQVLADTAPFRDVFNSIFFISVGMLLDLDVVAAMAPVLLLLTPGIVLLKVLTSTVAVMALSLPVQVAVAVGLGLAQVGEFSFVLLRAGKSSGLVDEGEYQVLLAVAVLTMLATPLLVTVAPAAARAVNRASRGRLAAGASPLPEGKPVAGMTRPGLPRVIIAGYGLHGRQLARQLREGGIPHVIVDINGETVRRAVERGRPALYGDVTRRDILEHVGVESAQIIVFAINDRIAIRQAIPLARALNPGIHIIARSRHLAEIRELVRCGADEVVVEEFESSIETLSRVLERLHIPRNVIRAQARLLRDDTYRLMRAPTQSPGISRHLIEALEAGITETYLITEGHRAAGMTIRELDLRSHAGATIVVIVRRHRQIPSPAPTERLAAGDVLVLVGSHQDMERAFSYLDGLAVPAEEGSESEAGETEAAQAEEE